ncbi:hypothetical protein [Bacillus massilinigeriensis]|nr:hypothetical protein [Bacillus massilionigeriensis]
MGEWMGIIGEDCWIGRVDGNYCERLLDWEGGWELLGKTAELEV